MFSCHLCHASQGSLEEEKSSETTVCVSMKELNITLNKREYPLALCHIEGVALELSLGSSQVCYFSGCHSIFSPDRSLVTVDINFLSNNTSRFFVVYKL